MNKSIKRNVVISAILAIMLCVSLIAGATFALFTSESGVNIAVTSGKVDVVASVNTDSVYTKSKGTEYTQGGNHMYSGEEAKFENGELTVSNMVPGDGITFNIVIKNNSSIEVKYRRIISCLSDNGLLSGLNVEIGKVANYDGTSISSDYETLAVNSADITVPVKIELPEDAGNVYQDKTLTLSYKVEAVQGNADMSTPDTDTYYVYTAMDLVNFKKNYNKIAIMNDIDLTGYAWNAIEYGSSCCNLEIVGMCEEGKTKTIKGLSDALLIVEAGAKISIKNLTIDSANILGNSSKTTKALGTAAFVACMDTEANLVLENCHVKNSTIIAQNYTDDKGTLVEPRSAGLVGFISQGTATIKNCSVEDCTIKSDNGSAAIVTFTYANTTIENCSVKGNTAISCTEDRENGAAKCGYLVGTVGSVTNINNCTVEKSVTLSNLNAKDPVADGFVGRISGGELNIDDGKYIADGVIFKDNVYMISSAKGLVYCADTFNTGTLTLGKTFMLTTDIDMSGIEWTPWCNVSQYFNGTFDGQNCTISNLTINDTGVAKGHATGFIGRLGANGNGAKTIKDVTFDNANVSGYHWVAVAVGYNEYGSMSNVKVTNSSVTNTHKSDDTTGEACGDKAGAVVGMVGSSAAFVDENGVGAVDSCSATNCTIKGARDVGQIVGMAYQSKDAKNQVTNCTATNVTVSCNAQTGTCIDKGEDKTNTNVNSAIVGRLYVLS